MSKLTFRFVELFIVLLLLSIAHFSPAQITFRDEWSQKMVGAEVILDVKNLRQKLLQGALEKAEITLALPLPNGDEVTFVAFESPVMETGLSMQFPETKSFLVQGIQYPNWKGRVAISPFGLVAVILTEDGTLIVEPTDRYHAPNQYRTYFDKEFSSSSAPVACGTQGKADGATHEDLEKSVNCLSVGTSLRKYRIALASSGEFTNGIGGGTLAGTNAIINERLTALNVIYENEIAIHFDLVASNNNIIFFNAATDGLNPATSPTDQRPSSAHTTITSGIGSGNFDIGHALYEIPNTGSGFSGSGVAGLGVVCNDSRKAQGWTGTTANAPLSFVMGIFAHEVAHQLNAAHSFYGTDGFCFPGQRTPGNGYEPGSGTTLMSYSGTCNTHNIFPGRATNYFHIHNLVQINNYVNSTTCEVTTASGNTPPVVTIPNNFTIPKGTPFELIGSATDAQDVNLTYIWEEYDTDNLNLVFPQGGPNDAANSTTAPLFRSFDPSSSGNKRTFPKLSDIVNNTQTLGEILPQVGRTIKMRLTVRDNHAGITGQAVNTGGVTCEELSITVNANSGPFTVNAPNTSVTWATGSNQTISWSVASTNSFCANVNILLSTDGGFTYPFVLASNTPNDGSQSIVVPAGVTNTSQARVRVECANTNATFFDISNVNFTINSSCSAGGSRLCPTTAVVGAVGAANLNLGTKRFFSSQTISSRVITFDTNDPSAPRAIATSQNGTVCTTSGTAKYELVKFYVETTGAYNLTTTFAAFNNTAIFIADGFNVSSPCTGNKFVGANAYSSGGSIQAFVPATINLTACTEYVMVHYGSSSTETITLAGPGVIYRSDTAPGASYSYTFVAINSSNGQIAAIDPNANFSTPAQGTLSAGNYTVKGISYLTTDGSIISVGTTETAILNSGKCLLFSSNVVSLQITAPQNASMPTNVSATDGTFSDKVRVTWSGTAGNFFRVYRNTSNNSATAVALSAWQTATTYDDLSAVLSTTYYYWLKAATDNIGSNISAFSGFDTGFSESCTPAEVNLTTPITGTVTIEATGAINASSSIEPGANATFQAGESINLTVGFQAKAGSTLTCIIAPIGQRCGPANSPIEARTVQISAQAPTDIQCFPNPFDGDLTIQYDLDTAQTVSATLYDLTGRRVQTIVQNFQEVGTQQLYLNGATLSLGAYWLILKGETWQKIEKIIRQ